MYMHTHNTYCIPQMEQHAVSVWGMQSICWMLPLAMPECYSIQPTATTSTHRALFPGPAQLSVACSTEKGIIVHGAQGPEQQKEST